ncbi:bifunctional 2-C-methyl-D-erythritol 4-phosphate cytidylyltransferase/2-C-methyl-D-erythritol 2,4-cyclodiphosphate synthase [Campylobacter sp. RM16192]|uniref:bifunctional 2-C-methyl-D-erythritol 4-phosphate cytidylyltransferase/2-C-methyl-D-erythritol 2,4-cyclodiphosphate synthase n=1 Tax=Campylobacter sp. RM16192 TaxID=1660080 RepID=UPI0014526C1E|nr:bifunctional 2-C-methyl-D-erythritol 4-phosphate cytidylyltransferase/2-C-methyl-D-erythritol 2,4-cyclodiphosphate synthase [Campylobacter sp. RM16192]QCD52204.1 bifunctional 2-C-methyl-D-erythritol 4-phosphate cytidylyltransferase / 2-C-methyl-D-erythritol 2,4-cyclodiphosphate synthase protein [Campylobacter sp. RM16192]
MFDISLVMLGAGNSTRFEMPVKKQWLRVGSDPLWLFAVKNLSSHYPFKEIIIVGNEAEYMSKFAPQYNFVSGGVTRQESLKNALKAVSSEFVLVSDIARPCISANLLSKIVEGICNADCVVPVLKVADTVYLDDDIIDRQKVKLVQTPQLSRTSLLRKALESDQIYTDDSSAMRAAGAKIWYVLGEESARKITFKEDLAKIPCLKAPKNEIYLGNGFDVHAFEDGNFITICGEKIPHEFAFKAHSDGDVGVHALIDAILGATSLGDIGELFPDTDAKYKGADSIELLKEVYKLVQGVGFELVNADITIMAQKPKISKFKLKMASNIANTLNISASRINVKATTTEQLGFVGRGEGIAASATASLKYYDWTEK